MTDMDNIKYAGFWRRFIALIIDSFVLVTIQICLVTAAMAINEEMALQFATILQLGSVFIYWLYYAGMESSSFQGTLGKAVIGLAVTDIDGKQISFLRATGRNLGKILSSAIFSIGFLLAAFTKRKQALHDMPANCLVIQNREFSLFKLFLVAILFMFLTFVMTFGYVGLFMLSEFTKAFQGMGNTTMSSDDISMTFEADPGMAMDISPEEVIEEIKNTEPIPTGSRKLSLQDYETLLSATPPNLKTRGPTTKVGPVVFEVTTFFADQLWLEVYAVSMPNFSDGLASGRIDIDLIEDKAGKNYYDPEHNFETDFFRRVSFNSQDQPEPHIKSLRSINFMQGLNEANFGRIKGTLVFSLPVNVEGAKFNAGDAGQEKTVAGSQVKLESINGNEVRFHYSGIGKNYLRILGFNEAGQELKSSSHSLISEEGQTDTNLFAQFNGNPVSAEVIVAGEIVEKSYPFDIKP